MYYSGQIVWDSELCKPVNCDTAKGRTRHFIDGGGKIVCPASIKEAKLLLKRNIIVPAPIPSHWCWSCDHRKTDTPSDACEAKQDHIRCSECNVGTIYSIFRKKGVCSTCFNQLKKTALKSIAEELLKEVDLIKMTHDSHSSNVSRLIAELVEFDDPYFIKRDGAFRDRIDKMNLLYSRDREASKTKKDE